MVSRVLNGRSHVAPDTRERIEQLLGGHGYGKRARRRTRAGLGQPMSASCVTWG